jgi:hypothetical protein
LLGQVFPTNTAGYVLILCFEAAYACLTIRR